ncbi:MAG: trypsin-like serine protease [Gammaproteobacteria bacterium]|nr:trypsin-like serine protease [Gammaproteobacteria bacterium]
MTKQNHIAKVYQSGSAKRIAAALFGLITLWVAAPLMAASVPAGVVDITLPFVAEDGKLYVRHGRGVLIGPRTVMTAAHVAGDMYSDSLGRVSEQVLWQGVQVKHLATGHKVFAEPGQVHLHPSVPLATRSVSTVIPEAEIDSYLLGSARFFDVAVFGLKEALGDEVAALPELAASYPGIFEKLGVVVGSSKRRLVETVVTGVDRFAVHTTVAMDGALADTVTVPGDSGGPLFVRSARTGKLEVYGIASALTNSSQDGSRSAMYARADLVRNWVVAVVGCVEKDGGPQCGVLARNNYDAPVAMR